MNHQNEMQSVHCSTPATVTVGEKGFETFQRVFADLAIIQDIEFFARYDGKFQF